MERQYFCNLLFFNNKLVDTEHAKWQLKGENAAKYTSYNNSFRIIKSGYYLEHIQPINITTKKFTVAFSYKIDKTFLQKTNFKPKDIYSLKWNSGEIKVLEFDSDNNTSIKIVVNGNDLSIPVNYLKDKNWNSLVLSCDNGRLQLFHNGIKKREDVYTNISYNFTYLKFGNYMIQDDLPEGPVIEYNNLVLVNDCLYNEDFDPNSPYLHLLFPEVVYSNIQQNNVQESIVAAPYIFSSKDSYNDIINNYEVTRHKNYIPDKSLQYLKYHFD